MNEKELARNATIRLYALRIIKDFIQLPVAEYDGSFDCRAVADSCAIPKTSKLTEHQICWKALFSKFNMAWAVF